MCSSSLIVDHASTKRKDAWHCTVKTQDKYDVPHRWEVTHFVGELSKHIVPLNSAWPWSRRREKLREHCYHTLAYAPRIL